MAAIPTTTCDRRFASAASTSAIGCGFRHPLASYFGQECVAGISTATSVSAVSLAARTANHSQTSCPRRSASPTCCCRARGGRTTAISPIHALTACPSSGMHDEIRRAIRALRARVRLRIATTSPHTLSRRRGSRPTRTPVSAGSSARGRLRGRISRDGLCRRAGSRRSTRSATASGPCGLRGCRTATRAALASAAAARGRLVVRLRARDRGCGASAGATATAGCPGSSGDPRAARGPVVRHIHRHGGPGQEEGGAENADSKNLDHAHQGTLPLELLRSDSV